MKPIVAISGEGYPPDALQHLDAHFDLLRVGPQPIADQGADLEGVSFYVLGGDERLGEEELDLLPNLKTIVFAGTSAGTFVDLAAAEARGISILTTPGILSKSVAEFAVAMAFAMRKNLPGFNENAKRGLAAESGGADLSTSCFGVVGLGAVGSQVARIVRRGLDSRVVYTSTAPNTTLEAELGIQFVSLADVFSLAEVVILCLPFGPETEGIVGQTLLQSMRPEAVLISISDSRIIDPVALSEALWDRSLSAAAVDGYWVEPIPRVEQDPYGLLSMPDSWFVCTPHVAGKSANAWTTVLRASLDLVRLTGLGGSSGAEG